MLQLLVFAGRSLYYPTFTCRNGVCPIFGTCNKKYIRIRFLTEKLANWQLHVRTKKMVVDGVTD